MNEATTQQMIDTRLTMRTQQTENLQIRNTRRSVRTTGAETLTAQLIPICAAGTGAHVHKLRKTLNNTSPPPLPHPPCSQNTSAWTCLNVPIFADLRTPNNVRTGQFCDRAKTWCRTQTVREWPRRVRDVSVRGRQVACAPNA